MKTKTGMFIRKLSITVPILLTSLLTACGTSDNSTPVANTAPVTQPSQTTCLWQGPLTISNPNGNFAFPDTNATYWSGVVTVPAGAKLFLNGKFPHSRYISYVSYNADATPSVSLPDTSIIPNSSSINPFVVGNVRTASQRDYRIQVVPGAAPSGNIPSNTLYAPVANNQTITIMYRVYAPDQGKDVMGGVPLPKVELQLADGTIQTEKTACQTLNASQSLVPRLLLDQKTYLAARDQANTPAWFPASNPPIWHAGYNVKYDFTCGFYGACGGNPVRTEGYFANPDNAYTYADISRQLGKVVVLRGKIPTTPATLQSDRYMQQGNLRYWSMCSNEYYSQKVTACLYDQQVPINGDGEDSIGVSETGDRPSNATSYCGVGYREWSSAVDDLCNSDVC